MWESSKKGVEEMPTARKSAHRGYCHHFLVKIEYDFIDSVKIGEVIFSR